jgi:hypothetical protein
MVTRLQEGTEKSQFNFQQGEERALSQFFQIKSLRSLTSNRHHGFFLLDKVVGYDMEKSLPSSAKVQNTWSYTSTLLYIFMVLCLIKQT